MQTTLSSPRSRTIDALGCVMSAKAHLRGALKPPHDEVRIRDALALLAEAEKILTRTTAAALNADTQLVYAHVPLLRPLIDLDQLDAALPDGLFALTPLATAPALMVHFALDDVPQKAVITLRAAESLRDALTAMISEAASCRMADAAAPEAAR